MRDNHKEREKEMKMCASSVSVADEIEFGLCSPLDISTNSSNHSWSTGREKDDGIHPKKHLKTLGSLESPTGEELEENTNRRKRWIDEYKGEEDFTRNDRLHAQTVFNPLHRT
jgi:hypothetical protein